MATIKTNSPGAIISVVNKNAQNNSVDAYTVVVSDPDGAFIWDPKTSRLTPTGTPSTAVTITVTNSRTGSQTVEVINVVTADVSQEIVVNPL